MSHQKTVGLKSNGSSSSHSSRVLEVAACHWLILTHYNVDLSLPIESCRILYCPHLFVCAAMKLSGVPCTEELQTDRKLFAGKGLHC